MERQTRIRIGNIIWPFFAGLSFVIKAIDRTLLGWWLWPLLQRKANKALRQDVRRDLPFLSRKSQFVKEKRILVLPFDYAEASVGAGNLLVCFTRGRGEINVSLSPNHSPRDRYELAVVMAALDSKGITEVTVPTELIDLDGLLQSRFGDLNEEFSETRYPEFKKKLLDIKQDLRVLTREAEWELNRKLYPLRTR